MRRFWLCCLTVMAPLVGLAAVLSDTRLEWRGGIPRIIPIQVQETTGKGIKGVVGTTLSFLEGEIYDLSELRILDRDYAQRGASFKALGKYPDGSLRKVQAFFRVEATDGGRKLFLCKFDASESGLPYPELDLKATVQNFDIAVQTGNIGALMGLSEWAPPTSKKWQEGMEPAWWKGVQVQVPSEADRMDLPEFIEHIDRSYAEHRMAREAIKLYHWVYSEAQGVDLNSALRAAYKIAWLYEVFLRDFVRSFKWYERCNNTYVPDPGEARQNFIASSFGMIRCYEALDYQEKALILYSLLLRELEAEPSDFGVLFIPEVHLRIGNIHKRAKDIEGAKRHYERCIEATRALPQDAPFVYRSAFSAAEIHLKEIRFGGINLKEIQDGRYEGTGIGYNSIITAELEVRDGIITKLHLLKFNDKRPFDAYDIIPQRIISQQQIDVDAVTGATISSDGIKHAVKDAIYKEKGKGKKEKG